MLLELFQVMFFRNGDFQHYINDMLLRTKHIEIMSHSSVSYLVNNQFPPSMAVLVHIKPSQNIESKRNRERGVVLVW
jgi:hypothetical protein